MALRFAPARGAGSFSLSALTRGPAGPAATVAVGTVTELAPGATPTVANGGSSSAASLNFGLPGTPTIAIGDVTTVAPGQPATVTNSGTAAEIILDFDIPQGTPGNDGAVAGPVSSTVGNLASFGSTDGNTIADSGYAPIDEDSFATNSATRLPSQQSVKAYVDAADALKAPLASPTLTGVPAAPTAATGTNTTQVATTAFVKAEIPLVAMGQGKHTIWIPASAMWARTTNGPAAASRELTTGGDIMIKGFAFDTTTEEGVQFYIGFPKSWNKGTITFQAFWTNASGLSTETVSWGLSAGAFTDSDAIDTTDLGTEVRVSDTWLAQGDLHVTAESGAVTVGNTPIDDDMVIGQIVRSVANDNMTGDAELLGVKIFYTTNAATDA